MTQVWITGVGTVTPLGHSFAAFAENLLAGKSGAGGHQVYPDETLPLQTAASAGEIAVVPGWDRDAFHRLNRYEQIALSCTTGALHDAGLWDRRERLRVGIVLGLGAEYLRVWEIDWLAGGRRVCEPSQDAQSIVHWLNHSLALRGPAVAVAAACASGGIALALGRKWIEAGLVDVCLAGGCDLITPMAYDGFYNLRALSRREGPPQQASRPFDCGRDGFVMGEGGAVLTLEPAAAAQRRAARVYGRLAGCGVSSDASHMVIPSSDPHPAAHAMRMAMDDAGVSPDEVDYLNAHATSTPVGDRAEAAAIQLAFGPAAARLPVSSTKSMTGHLLSGAAAVEAVACLVALDRQAVPPTINLDEPDPECPLLHVPHQAQCRPVRVAMSNSFGFGGSNTSLVLAKAA